MLKIAVSVNPNKDKNLKNTIALLDILKNYNVRVFLSDSLNKSYGGYPALSGRLLSAHSVEYCPEHMLYRKANVCIVFGGDGTIIKIAKKAAPFGTYILGINLGRVGYLAELEISELELLKPLLNLSGPEKIETCSEITVDSRMMLKAEIIHANRVIFSANSINDIVISKGAVSRMAGLELKSDGKTISSYRADGIVISTPTGSTAYCMSAGGPIIDPKLECICAIPVCPYMCVNPGAIVFSNTSEIEVAFHADKINEAFCTVDGVGAKPISDGDTVKITKSPYYTKLIRLKDIDFYSLLYRKMGISGNQNV